MRAGGPRANSCPGEAPPPSAKRACRASPEDSPSQPGGGEAARCHGVWGSGRPGLAATCASSPRPPPPGRLPGWPHESGGWRLSLGRTRASSRAKLEKHSGPDSWPERPPPTLWHVCRSGSQPEVSGRTAQLPVLTHLDQSLAGHGVPRVDQLPAGRVDQRAAEGMLAVPHQAGLKLERGRLQLCSAPPPPPAAAPVPLPSHRVSAAN